MCRGNRNDFYSTASLNVCLGYLLDNECYASLAVLLTQIQERSLRYRGRLFPMYEDHSQLKNRGVLTCCQVHQKSLLDTFRNLTSKLSIIQQPPVPRKNSLMATYYVLYWRAGFSSTLQSL